MGAKVSFWAGSLFVVEEIVDQLRHNKDFVSTALAGLSIAGAFSAWSMHTGNPLNYVIVANIVVPR